MTSAGARAGSPMVASILEAAGGTAVAARGRSRLGRGGLGR